MYFFLSLTWEHAMTYLCHYNGKAETIDPSEDGFKKFAKPGVWYRC